MNEWIKRKADRKGICLMTGMSYGTIYFDLPAKFSIHETPTPEYARYRCRRDDSGSLVWKSRTVIEIDGRDYNLRREPRYSVMRGDYIFDVEHQCHEPSSLPA